MYIHESKGWPHFKWVLDRLSDDLADVRHRQGRLIGHMESLGFPLRQEAVLQTLSADVIKSSEIEGEHLNPEMVRSSIARRLGMDVGGLKASDRHVEGIVEMTLDATERYEAALTNERLFEWQAALFPTGRSGVTKIRTGAYRTGPIEVVSGPLGKTRVHFAGPPAARVGAEMRAFLKWFNAKRSNQDGEMDPVLKAGLAHLWFVTIHPFEDGNGRIARAVADMALAWSEGSPQRFYSMSAQIREERGDYYAVLERTQKGSLDVTEWLVWFVGCLGRAIDGAQNALRAVLVKARFWERAGGVQLNDRQRRVLNRLLDGFEGKLTTSKYAKLTGCSQDTALRDILALIDAKLLVQNPGGGRSTSYSISL